MGFRVLNKEQAIEIVGESYDDNQKYYINYDDDTLSYQGFGMTIKREVYESGTSGKDVIQMDYTSKDIDIKKLFNLN